MAWLEYVRGTTNMESDFAPPVAMRRNTSRPCRVERADSFWPVRKLLKPRGPPLAQKVYEISKSSNLPKDFWISREISRFHERFQDFTIIEISGFHERFRDSRRDFKISRDFRDFTKDFGISREISRLHERFRDCCEDFVNFHPEYKLRFQAWTFTRDFKLSQRLIS